MYYSMKDMAKVPTDTLARSFTSEAPVMLTVMCHHAQMHQFVYHIQCMQGGCIVYCILCQLFLNLFKVEG